jgi:UDP-3-O-[3-hydroxymyristoyl] glucosamine N-acyltransferase
MSVPQDVGNPRFFTNTGPHGLRAVAAAAGCDPPEADVPITGLASLEDAVAGEISFLGTSKHAALLQATLASAVLVPADMVARVPVGCAALVIGDPFAGWAKVAALFHPMPKPKPGIHRSAVVEEGAIVDPTAEICAQAVIEAGAEIGAHCRVGPGAVIGAGVVLGAECRIDAHVSISHAVLGARVLVYPGARIGQDGFGFTPSPQGFISTPQLCGVVIGDDVEIGANTTIDRGALRNTVIGAGTRLDNLVQVAHNVRIGRHCAIAAQTGLSGTSELEDFVMMGGQAGVADHVKVGAKARVGAQSGVMSEIAAGAVVVSSPARPVREVFREIAWVKRMAKK